MVVVVVPGASVVDVVVSGAAVVVVVSGASVVVVESDATVVLVVSAASVVVVSDTTVGSAGWVSAMAMPVPMVSTPTTTHVATRFFTLLPPRRD